MTAVNRVSGAATSADGIVEAAIAAAREVGIGGLTGRIVADHAKTSPSAINYRFGNIDGLYRAIHETLSQRSAQWRAEQLASLTDDRCEFLSVGGVVAGCINDLAQEGRRFALMLQELREIHAYRICDFGALPHEEWAATSAFFKAVVERFAHGEEWPEVWHLFAEGSITYAFSDAEPAYRTAWLSTLAQRLEARLSRSAVALKPWAPDASPLAISLPELPAWPDGKVRIVEATLRLIGRIGISQVTHRRVAEEAGLSLAATTYFFASKEELIHTAFQYLHLNSAVRAEDASMDDGTHYADLMLTPDGELRWEIGAYRALFHAAIHNPSLQPLVNRLRLRGHGSAKWLKRRGIEGIDRIDGLVWSLLAAGIVQRAMLLTPQERRAYLDSVSRRLLQALYGVA